ncbi:MAG: beta-galactosidase [Armatimonadota bacterium]
MTNNKPSSQDYIPFGAQYYRAPTPNRSEWAKDLDQFKAAGFNTLKYWAQWRWNNPRPGEYDFTDLDELMDLAAERGLKVIINVIFDVAPSWLFKQYPECRMVTADGRMVGPAVNACRQIGGVPGPCLNHPESQAIRMQFLQATVQRYASHPALDIWDLWNEPELTCCLMREPSVENQVCYCPSCASQFIEWLQRKFGSLEAVNARWGRNYQSWDELELPVMPHAFGDTIDWRMFQVNTITAEMQRRADVTRQCDKHHQVMCHTVPMPVFNPVTCASDDWALAEIGDLHGNSLGSDPFAADLIRSAARGKKVINAEIHALPGSSLARVHPIGLAEMQRHIFVPLGHGIKGFVFWQYRPELLGLESPAWGLTNPDGSPAPWHADTAKINAMLQQNARFLNNTEPQGEEIGIFYHPENHVFSWCCYDFGMHDQAVQGVYQTLYNNNYRVRFIHPSDLQRGIPQSCRTVIYPFPYVLDQPTADGLKLWVEQGGSLIGEAFFGNLVRENSMHSMTVPGYGFDEVFGAREGVVQPFTAQADLYRGGRELGMSQLGPIMTTTVDLPGLAAGHRAQGFLVHIPLIASSAQTLATFGDGSPAVTLNNYGKGQAVLCGTMLSRAAKQDPEALKLLAALVSSLAPTAQVACTDGAARVDVITDGSRHALVVQNLHAEPVQLLIRPNADISAQPIVNAMTAEQTDWDDQWSGWNLTLAPSAVELYFTK